MSEITIANRDGSILSAVQSALAGATVNQSRVFAAVTATTSARQAAECQFTASPAAIVRYLTTSEDETPEGVLGCAVFLELIVAIKTPCNGVDELPRLQAVLGLLAAARNAVCAAKPADSCDWGDGKLMLRRLEFGRPQVDTSERAPWAVARLPLTVAYTLDSDTAH